MANLPLAFAELLAGGVLITAGVSSATGSVKNVISGLEHGVAPFPGSSGGGSASSSSGGSSSSAGYVNPFPGATASRVDQGVDYTITQPVVAPGQFRVTYIGQGLQGFGTYIAGVLESGPLAGKAIYFAEGLAPASGVQVGSVLQPGQAIANPTQGGVIESGWANPASSWFAPLAQSTGGYSEGDSTAAGASFNRFVQALGGPLGHLASTILGGIGGQGLP